MWNRNTFERAFGDINSNAFVLSMKHGESDFFNFSGFLPFSRESASKILELQARREREGFGMFPFFWAGKMSDISKVKTLPKYVGNFCLVPNGGWSRHHDITFLQCSSPWNELNTFSAVQMFSFGKRLMNVKRFFHNPNISLSSRVFLFSFRSTLWKRGYVSDALFSPFTSSATSIRALGSCFVTPLITHVYRSFLHHLFVEHTKDLSRLVQLGMRIFEKLLFCGNIASAFLCHGVLFGKNFFQKCSAKSSNIRGKISRSVFLRYSELSCSTIRFYSTLSSHGSSKKKRIIVCGIIFFFKTSFFCSVLCISKVSSLVLRMSSAWIFARPYSAKSFKDDPAFFISTFRHNIVMSLSVLPSRVAIVADWLTVLVVRNRFW